MAYLGLRMWVESLDSLGSGLCLCHRVGSYRVGQEGLTGSSTGILPFGPGLWGVRCRLCIAVIGVGSVWARLGR